MINELELKKAELEKAFEAKKKQVQAFESDIALLTQLIALKREHGKAMTELGEILAQHNDICKAIEIEKAKPEEEVIKGTLYFLK